jgi:S1-C subfamily serine protease
LRFRLATDPLSGETLVHEVVEYSPAYAIGLMAKDVLEEVDGAK